MNKFLNKIKINNNCKYIDDGLLKDDTNKAGCDRPKLYDITYIEILPYDDLFYRLRVSFRRWGYSNNSEAKFLLADILYFKNKSDAKQAFKCVKRLLLERIGKEEIARAND